MGADASERVPPGNGEMDLQPNRKTPVHWPVMTLSDCPSIVFVTVCTDKRKRILARDRVHELLVDAWREAGSWWVGRYVIMPDHIHLFCAPASWDVPRLTEWVRFWKTLVSRRWHCRQEQPVWQKSFWDRQMRSFDGYDEKWVYVRQNPVRSGLVANADEWPYQGELRALEWFG